MINLISKLKKKIFNKDEKEVEWRKRNPHNNTHLLGVPINMMDMIRVGNYTYGYFRVHHFNGKSKLTIGNFCSIALGVEFILGGEHKTNNISTFPFHSILEEKKAKEEHCCYSRGDIVVEDDVWIGTNSIILSGVTIGQGAVIGAGSLVTKDVPPYAIVGGVPAKVIRMRFKEDVIELLKLKDYSRLTKEMIIDHYEDFITEPSTQTDLSWFPNKSR